MTTPDDFPRNHTPEHPVELTKPGKNLLAVAAYFVGFLAVLAIMLVIAIKVL